MTTNSTPRSASVMGLLGALALALSLSVTTGCGKEEVVAEARLTPVSTTRVIAVDFEENLEVTGELAARNHTTVAAEVSGRITEILIEEGAPVVVGASTMAIDPERHELALEKARAGLSKSQAALERDTRQYGRVRKLHRKGAISNAALDEARAAYRLAKSTVEADEAELSVATRALRDASVEAPFGGVVGRRLVSLGEFVQPGTPLVEFVSLDPMELVFHVAEVDSARIAVGQQLDVQVAPYPGEKFEAYVDVVYPTIDPVSHTLRVKASIANADGRLRPGLFARAGLGVQVRQGVAMVPESALLQRSDGAVVFTVDADGRAQRRVVETGSFREGLVEIRSGLSAGERVVTRGQADLIDGETVAVVDESSLGGDAVGVREGAISGSDGKPEVKLQ